MTPASSGGVPRITASPRRRTVLTLLVFNGLGQAACATAIGLGVRHVFGPLVRRQHPAGAGVLALTAAGFIVAAAAAAWLRARERYDAERLGQHYVHHLRMALYDHLAAITPRVLQQRTQGGVMLRFFGDLTQIRQWVSLGLARLVVGTTTAAGALVALAVLDVVFAAAVAVVLAATLAAALSLGRPLRDRVRRARRRRARLAANVAEQVTALAVVQAFGQVTNERRRVVRQSRSLTRAMVGRARALGQLRGLSEAGAILAPAAVLLAGAREVHAGRATPGTVVAAMTIATLVATAIRDLGRVPEYWNGSQVALERARSFLALPTLAPERPGARPLEAGNGRLAFAGVALDGVLEDINVVAEAGTVVAVTGANGAGKSTLLALAARLVDPDAGSVMLDGRDLRDVTLSSLRRAVAIAGPDLPLRRGDVRDNLSYRWPDAPDAELERVVRLTGLGEALDALPSGLATRVAERGDGLSSGERARVALARAIVGDPQLLLLDEVEAHLDADAASLVDRIVDDRRGRVTTVIVTHRHEVVQRADVVWRLHEGRIVAVEGRTAAA